MSVISVAYAIPSQNNGWTFKNDSRLPDRAPGSAQDVRTASAIPTKNATAGGR
jgi:hypothetical protein